MGFYPFGQFVQWMWVRELVIWLFLLRRKIEIVALFDEYGVKLLKSEMTGMKFPFPKKREYKCCKCAAGKEGLTFTEGSCLFGYGFGSTLKQWEIVKVKRFASDNCSK